MEKFIHNIEGSDLEKLVREHRQEFNDNEPEPNHENRFFVKLVDRFKKIISIIPYLFRVLIVTITVFIVSIVIWNSFIRKDRHEITLKEKITVTYQKLTK